MSAGASPRLTQVGRYEIQRWLGSGSFAAVYLAFDPALDVPVAIKLLGDNHSSIPEIRERFIQEARMLRKLANDRTVTVRDIGEIDGQPYFVMDAFEQGTLHDRLADSPAIDATALRNLVEEIGRCLRAVHDGGLVHRDLKPSNLLIGGQAGHNRTGQLLGDGERLVLADFGIARSSDASGLTVGAGTHGFMAPEQMSPLTTIDHRVDIYAATAIVRLVASKRWGPSDTPPALTAAFAAGLAHDPADRPQGATQWTQAMLAALPAADGEREPRAAVGPTLSTKQKIGASIGALGIAAAALYAGLAPRAAAPTIVGPTEVIVGTSATYSFVPDDDTTATYVWVDGAGGTHHSPMIEITPRSSGDLTLTLEETIDGATEVSTLQVSAVDP